MAENKEKIDYSKDGQLYKLAIFGIQNAGKTSILKVLSREFDMLANLKPTIKVERTFLDLLGKNILVWDYGGQEKYREQYLSQPERFFNGISIVFYVLDIQDPDLLGSNIMYFDGLYKRVQKYSPDAKFVLLFHKLDPNLELPQNAIQLQKKFIDAISYHFREDNKEYTTYRTSIYNPISLVKAFSQSLIDKEEITKNVSQILKSFCKTYDLLFASTLTENFFELGFHMTDAFDAISDEYMPTIFNDVHKNLENWLNPKIKPKSQFGSIGVISDLYAVQRDELKVPIFTLVGFDVQSKADPETLQKAVKELNEELVKLLLNLNLDLLLS